MIDDLDRTIEVLLRRELPPEIVGQTTITFTSPDAHFPPTAVTLPAIDLFLYEIRENRELREFAPELEKRQGALAVRRRPPVRIDCFYLITAWQAPSAPKPAFDEHKLLGAVLKVLLRHPALPVETLQGVLKGQRTPPPTSSLQPGRLQSLAEFWQALGGRPKAALTYSITLAVDLASEVEAGPPVAETDVIVGLNGGGLAT